MKAMDKTVYIFDKFKAVCFLINGLYYIYDSYSNKILQISSRLFSLIEDMDGNENTSNDSKVGDMFQLFQEKFDCLKTYSFEKSFFDGAKIKNDSSLSQKLSEVDELVLNITEDCNFRCKYCFYSKLSVQDTSYNQHNQMTEETAIKSVDLFMEKSQAGVTYTISFFGGEPLLNFKLIKNVVEYANRKYDNIVYTITTNGYLLKGEILKYLVDNDVRVTISIDGPKGIHNANRVTMKGVGSFDIVKSNIETIVSSYPKYFQTNVFLNAVVDMDMCTDFQELEAFFDLNFKGLGFSVQPAEYTNDFAKSGLYKRYKEHFLQRYVDEHVKGFSDQFSIPRMFVFNEMHKRILLFHYREDVPVNLVSKFVPMGLCVPGSKRLFVSYNGDFYPCSKVFYHQSMVIGNIYEGIDIPAVINYYNEYIDLSEGRCRNCWAIRICKSCYLSAMGQLSGPTTSNDACVILKQDYLDLIGAYIMIISHNPNAFEIYNNLNQ